MNLTSIFCQLFSVFYPLKSKTHLVPHHIAVNRYRYSFVKKTELAIVMDQFFLAGEDKTSPSFLFRIMDGAAEHYSRISFLPACRNRIQPENHLPCAMFIMHVCFLIHFVSKIRKVCHHTVRKRNQFSLFKEEPEMIAVINEPLFELSLIHI